MSEPRFPLLREVGLWLTAASLLGNIITFALLWWLLILNTRDRTPAFTVDPNPSTETAVVWTRDSAVIRTRALKP